MPLSHRERKAIWFARQHYFNAFIDLLDAASTEASSPATVQAALKISLEMIRDRIDADNPDTHTPATEPTDAQP